MSTDRDVVRDRFWAWQIEDWTSFDGVPGGWTADFASGFAAGSQRAAAMLRQEICGDVHENYDPQNPTDCAYHRSENARD